MITAAKSTHICDRLLRVFPRRFLRGKQTRQQLDERELHTDVPLDNISEMPYGPTSDMAESIQKMEVESGSIQDV
jgi:hypothetical protein